MVHEKYIKRGGKLYGPYYYESYREDGKVKKRYIKSSPEKNHGIYFIILGMLLIVGFSVFLISQYYPKSIEDIIYSKNSNVEGFADYSRMEKVENIIVNVAKNTYSFFTGLVTEDEVITPDSLTEEPSEVPVEEVGEEIIEENTLEEQEEIVEETILVQEENKSIGEEIIDSNETTDEINNVTEEIIIDDSEISNKTIEINQTGGINETVGEIDGANKSEGLEGNKTSGVLNETIINNNTIESNQTNNKSKSNLVNNSIEETINQTESLIPSIEEVLAKKSKIIVGKPVKNIRIITVINTTELNVELPKGAENISVKTGDEIQEVLDEIDKEKIKTNKERVSSVITGNSISSLDSSEGIFNNIFNFFSSLFITGNVVNEENMGDSIIETINSTIVKVDEVVNITNEDEIAVEYYTEAPKIFETNISEGKKIIISAPDELNYTDVLAYTQLPYPISNENNIKLYWNINLTKTSVTFEVYDLDEDGLIDYISWNVPHLSEQEYQLIIKITKAEHLDSNRTFVEDVYDYVKARDDNWTTIPDEHYLRVTFEQNLTSDRDITIYAKSDEGGRVEVYEKDGDVKIADFGVISEDKKYKIYLTELCGPQGGDSCEPQDVFDLKVTGGSVDFDWVVDPAAWWDSDWFYKQAINLSVSSGATPQNYQVKLAINSTNNGTNFNWTNECVSSNSSRLRFINGSENTELDFWVESCNVIGQNMTVWVEVDQNITTTPNSIYMYYGNIGGTATTNGTATFDFFDDFNGASVDTAKWTTGGGMSESGGVATGSTSGTDYLLGKTRITLNTMTYIKIQDKSTSGIARPGVLATNGNPYSVVGFGWQDYSDNYRYTDTYNTGITQVQRNQFTTNWYELETSYNSTTVDFIVNGALLGTHTTQIPTSDKVLYGQVEGNANYDLFYTRKWVSVEPTFIFGTEETPDTSITSLSPVDGYVSSSESVIFNCSATSSSTTELTNITLYGNWSGGWHANETKSLTGTSNTTSFTKTVSSTTGNYLWNCLVYDNESNLDWFDSNYTFSIDRDVPQVTINSPIGTMADVTPLINVSSSETGTIWYNIDNGENTTLCTSCNNSQSNFAYISEGAHTIYVFANDSAGNVNNTESSLFTVDMNGNYYDDFDDNSSVSIWNNVIWGEGNLSFSGISRTSYYYDFGPGDVKAGYTQVLKTTAYSVEQGYGWRDTSILNSVDRGDYDDVEEDIIYDNADNSFYVNVSDGDWNVTIYVGDKGNYAHDNMQIWCNEVLEFSDIDTAAQTVDNYSCNFTTSGGEGINITIHNNGGSDPNWVWAGIDVVPIIGGNSINFTSYSINTTNNITSIDNVTWTESGTDANNNITVDISADNGANWYSATSGQNISSGFTGANNSLIYRSLFATNQSKTISLLDMNISWSEGTVADTEYPIFSLYYDNNASLLNSGTGLFNVTLLSTNGTVLLEINGTNVTATNLTANVYNTSYAFTSNGTYTYRWHSWGNGTSENYNVSGDRNYFVNFSDVVAPYFDEIPTNQTIEYKTALNYDLNASDETGFDSYAVNDTTNFLINSTGNLKNNTVLARGLYYINLTINDTSNNLNSSVIWVNVTDTTPPSINFTSLTPPNDTTTTNTSIEINVSIENADDLDTVKWNWNGTNYTIMNDSLVLMMNFDNVSSLGENDVSNHTEDVSGYNNDGNCTGMGVGCNWTNGKYGKGISFDGGDDVVVVSYNSSLGSTTAYTFATWVYTISDRNYNVYYARATDGTSSDIEIYSAVSAQDLTLVHNRGNGGTFEYSTNNGFSGTSGVGNWDDLPLNTWTHLTVTFSSNTWKVYFNGVQVGNTITGVINPLDTTLPSNLGGRTGFSSSSDFLLGQLDEVRIYNRSLSADEIQILYMSNLNKYDTDKWAFYINQSKNATDGLDYGTYTYQSFAKDTSNNLNFTELRTITIGEVDNEYPLFSNIVNDTANNTQYIDNFNWGFNATITSTNATVGLEFNGINYTASNISASVFNVTINDLSAGTYSYYWWAYGNGTDKNYNTSATQSYTIAQNSSLVLGLTATTPIIYPTVTDFSGSGCPTQLSCSLNISNGVYSAGTISANYSTVGNNNYTSASAVFSVTINQNTSAALYTYLNNTRANITINNNTAIYLNATLFNVTGTVSLYNNGTLINIGSSSVNNLTAFNNTGLYNITAIYSGNVNYSGSSETWWVNVTSGFSLAIDLSSRLQQQINWTFESLPIFNQSVGGNNGTNVTEFYINVSVEGGTADLYIRGSGNLMTFGGDVLGLGNETFSFNITNSAVPSIDKYALTTTYSDNKIGDGLTDGEIVYLKFFLNAPSGQAAGAYNNTLEFKAVQNGQAP